MAQMRAKSANPKGELSRRLADPHVPKLAALTAGEPGRPNAQPAAACWKETKLIRHKPEIQNTMRAKRACSRNKTLAKPAFRPTIFRRKAAGLLLASHVGLNTLKPSPNLRAKLLSRQRAEPY